MFSTALLLGNILSVLSFNNDERMFGENDYGYHRRIGFGGLYEAPQYGDYEYEDRQFIQLNRRNPYQRSRLIN